MLATLHMTKSSILFFRVKRNYACTRYFRYDNALWARLWKLHGMHHAKCILEVVCILRHSCFPFNTFWLVAQAYTESVPQDLPVGREVMRVSATDIDDGNNSVVRYSLSPKKQEDGVYFRIDHETGVIFLNKTITEVSNIEDEVNKIALVSSGA